MRLFVNGKEQNCSDSLTVSQLLLKCNVKMPEMVSVELNDQILRRTDFGKTTLKDDDKVEFIYYMGGGEQICS